MSVGSIMFTATNLIHSNNVTHNSLSREEVRKWNKKGIRLIAWTVNLPSEKQYFEKNLKIAYLTDTVINSWHWIALHIVWESKINIHRS